MQIAALASGSGTVLRALIESQLPIGLLLVDRDCKASEIARSKGITTVKVGRDYYMGAGALDRSAFTEAVINELGSGWDLITMAGFMTILDKQMFEVFNGRVLNTHPSLLPAFPGANAVRDALEAGVQVTGCTVHVATPEVDCGPILAQQSVDVLPGDTEASLHERIKIVERELYPRTVRDYAKELDLR